MKNTLYMMVTTDKYELPLAVADSIKELATMDGKSVGAISSAMYYAKKMGTKCRYVKVVLDD